MIHTRNNRKPTTAPLIRTGQGDYQRDWTPGPICTRGEMLIMALCLLGLLAVGVRMAMLIVNGDDVGPTP